MSVRMSDAVAVGGFSDEDVAYAVYRMRKCGGFADGVRPVVQLMYTDDMQLALSKCVRVARRDGISPKDIKNFVCKATSGTYDYFMEIVDQYFEVAV